MMIEPLKALNLLSRDSDSVLFHVKSLADYFADQFPNKMIHANDKYQRTDQKEDRTALLKVGPGAPGTICERWALN